MTPEPQLKQPPTDDAASDSDLPNRLVGLLGLLLLGGMASIVLAPFLLTAVLNQGEVALEEASPDGAYRVVVESHAGWVYGPHRISVIQKDGRGRRKDLLSTMLYNDGANLSDANVALTWLQNGQDSASNQHQALLQLNGAEQDPACHLLALGQSPLAEDVPCLEPEDATDPAELLPESPVVLGP